MELDSFSAASRFSSDDGLQPLRYHAQPRL